jgi:LysR family hca operon transcriptional activator
VVLGIAPIRRLRGSRVVLPCARGRYFTTRSPKPRSNGVSQARAPILRAAIEDFFKRHGLSIKPAHQAENLAMAISLIASTGGISLLPLYAQNLLPKTIVSRPIQGVAPMVDLVIGYNEANSSPLLKFLLSKVEEIKFQVVSRDGG